MNVNNAQDPSSNDGSFFVDHASIHFEELIEGILAIDIIRVALTRCPTHWAVLMRDKTKMARFQQTMLELWEDGIHNGKYISE